MQRWVLVIDPQVAFSDAQASLAQAFGAHETLPIRACAQALERFLLAYRPRGELCLIRSEYRPGQFTAGELNHPYAMACVPGHGRDGDWCLSADAVAGLRVVTKAEESAVPALAPLLQTPGLTEVLVAGFLATSCVRKTVLDLLRVVPPGVKVGVLEDLVASRASNYASASARHPAALAEMRAAGARLLSSVEVLAAVTAKPLF